MLSALAFQSKAHWGYSAEFMSACRAELCVSEEDLESKTSTYVVAEIIGKSVGYYGLEQFDSSGWELKALFVSPAHIGTGIGRLLMEHAKSTVIKKGGQNIVIQGDPNAAQFYLNAGGQLSGERESESIPGRYLPLFTIPLAVSREKPVQQADQ